MSRRAISRLLVPLISSNASSSASGLLMAASESSAFKMAASFHSSVNHLKSQTNTWRGAWAGMGLVAASACALTTTVAAWSATTVAHAQSASDPKRSISSVSNTASAFKVIFVLGGPGSGKGTQCEKLTSEFKDVAHFSAGDLLREHVKSGSKEGNMVAEMIKNGQIVPAEVTVGLLKDAMERSGKTRILIDGFPRNDSNREVFEKVMGFDCSLVLYFDCPESVLEKRLLSRNQGRSDDNIETIKKRFKVFIEQSLPVINHYRALGKCKTINTDRPPEVIYREVRQYVTAL